MALFNELTTNLERTLIPTKYNLKHLASFTNKELFSRCLSYFLPHKAKLVVGFLSIFVISAANSGTAYLVKPAMDQIFVEKDADSLYLIPLAFFSIIVGKGIFRFLQNYLMNITGFLVLEQLRNELFTKIIKLPLSYFEESQTGMLMSRILGDVSAIRESIPTAVMLIREIITCVGLIGVIVYMDWKLALWAIFGIPLSIYPIIVYGKKLRQVGRDFQVQAADINSLIQERLSGVRIIKAFNMEDKEADSFKDESRNIVKLSIRKTLLSEFSSRIMELIGGAGVGVVLWYGGNQVLSGLSTPGAFFSFVAAMIMMYDPIKKINSCNRTLQSSLASAERVFSVLDSSNIQIEPSGSLGVASRFDKLDIKDITFTYPTGSTPALKNYSITIKRNEQVALVGRSGSGKTTLANLIPRFYDVSDGAITLNDIPILEYHIGELRRSIGMVSQDTFLFNKSIRDNIAYGNPQVAKDDVEKAAKAAFAHDFICDLPAGYDTIIGERGVKLSGGQKQRLTIARALVKNPPLLILDEATSALDTESERIVQNALENLMQERTTIVIAHRLSTVINADRIVVMRDGRIEDIGPHEELLQRCEYYQLLYNKQFGDKQS